MKILVTGGTGFIGSHLLAELAPANEVHALVRDPEKARRLPCAGMIRLVRGDLSESEPLPPDIEAVIQLAAVTKALTPAEFLHTNQHAASRFIDRLSGQKKLKKVIMLSSIAAVGPSSCDRPLTEADEPRPVSLYGKSKLLEERTFREKAPAPLTILRAPIVFGPGDYDMLAALRLLKKGFLPMLSSQNRYYSIIYVKDLVAGIAAALASPLPGEIYFLTHPQAIEWSGFMTTAARLLGRNKVRRIRIPHLAGRIAAEISELRCRILKKRAIFNRDKFCEIRHPCWLCSGEKARRLLHFIPRFDLESALAETIRWYRSEGLL